MIREGLLSYLQANLLLKGKWRNFILCGKYKILELLGTGGMGQVFLCEHIRMHKLVAVKILDAEKSADEMLVKRFTREARAAARANNHPNIVRAFRHRRRKEIALHRHGICRRNKLTRHRRPNGPLTHSSALVNTFAKRRSAYSTPTSMVSCTATSNPRIYC